VGLSKIKMSNYANYGKIRIRSNSNYRNANNLRKQKRKQLMSYYNTQLVNYIHGLLHPELAVSGSDIPKCPSYVSIPTSNITFREAFDIDPDKNGEFVLCWTPNFLATAERINKMSSGACKDYSRNWLGGFDETYNEYGFYPVAAYCPPASFRKYRLVSAGCKITYKGPTIERAGIVSYCLSYRQFPMVFFKEDENDFLSLKCFQNNMDPRYWGSDLDNFDITTIQNGMWNQVKNVQRGQQVFVVSVPTDPSDFIFEDDGFFYASASADDTLPIRTGNWTDGNGTSQTYAFNSQLAEDGTPCSYIFKGTNLTKDAKLYVEQFYNFEVIPTEESATILRPRKGSFTSEDLNLSKDIINKSLELAKGETANLTKNVINKMISDSNISIDNNAITNQINNKINQAVNKKLNKVVNNTDEMFANLRKNMNQKLKNNINTVKNIGKKVFTKDNIKFATELAMSILANKK
jgi:hypothetical protein